MVSKLRALEKAEKSLGLESVQEMNAMDADSLKKVIVTASQAMQQAKEELEANPNYEKAREDLKALSQGKKDVDKRQKARVQYALALLEEKGE